MLFFRMLSILGPLLLGIATGVVLATTVETWGILIEDIVRIMAIAMVTLLIVSTVLWASYRIFYHRAGSALRVKINTISEDLENIPSKISDPDYRIQHLWPLIPPATKAVVSWFAFANAFALVVGLMANLVLLATLGVQYLSVQKLGLQNELLQAQNDLLADQSKLMIDQAKRMDIDVELMGQQTTLMSQQSKSMEIQNELMNAQTKILYRQAKEMEIQTQLSAPTQYQPYSYPYSHPYLHMPK